MEQENNLKWVTAARTLDGYRLHLTFNDGSQRIFDCLPLIEKYQLFAPLRDKAVFDRFDLDGWTVTWLDGTVDLPFFASKASLRVERNGGECLLTLGKV